LSDPYKRKYRQLYDGLDVQYDSIPAAHGNDEYIRFKQPTERKTHDSPISYG